MLLCYTFEPDIKSKVFRIVFLRGGSEKMHLFFITSPEHEVLMVSYCGQWLSVVRRRASCDVRRVSCVVRQHLMFTL